MAERDSSAHTITLDVHSTHHDHVEDGFDVDMDVEGASTTTRYVVERELGRGGLSVVYAAACVDDGRRVAIKVPFSHLADKKALRSRYVREARITGSVSHPHVIRIDDSGVLPDGRPYLVTELVEGESLDQRLARGPLSADDTLLVGVQLLGAVAALGRKGIVHRDIKPSNIMVTSDGARITALKLLDLGIAQRVQETAQELPMAPGPAAGTPMYMAPEQLNGLSVDTRTDVYACGAVLYECMFGLCDDGHRNVRDARRQVVLDWFRPWVARPLHRYPSALLGAVATALHPQRRKRFASADEMEQVLLRVARRHGRPGAQRALRASLATSAALVLLGGAGYLARTMAAGPGKHGPQAAQEVPTARGREAPALQPELHAAPGAAALQAPVAAPPSAAQPTTGALPVSPLASAPSPLPATAAAATEPAPGRDPQSLAQRALGRRVARARAALDGGEYAAARRHARSALAVDMYDPDALRVVIESSVALHDVASAKEALASYDGAHPDAPDRAALAALVAR